jgi:hypothetical protein
LPGLAKILHWYEEHTEAFSLFFSQMLVMNFMGLANRSEIYVISSLKPIKSSVNKNVVYQEIAETVKCDSETDKKHPRKSIHHTEHDKKPRRYGEYQKEHIVFFKETGLGSMVIAVKIPSQTMHDILVCKPSHELHEKEGSK